MTSSSPDSIPEFLSNEQAMEIFLEIINGGARWTDLYNEIDIGGGTLSELLDEGEYLGLWTKVNIETEGGSSSTPYVPGVFTRQLSYAFSSSDLAEIHEERKEINAAFEKELQNLEEELRVRLRGFELPSHGEEVTPDPHAVRALEDGDIFEFPPTPRYEE